jgi:hypothetical protein
MEKIARVIDIAAITPQREIGNCKIRIATENKFKADRYLLLVPGMRAIKMCYIGCR